MDQHEASHVGSANYATWCIHRWLTTDEALSQQCRELTAMVSDAAVHSSLVFDGIWTTAEAARNLLADALRELVGELNPMAEQATPFADLIDTALGQIDWHEIADEFLQGGSEGRSPSAVL